MKNTILLTISFILLAVFVAISANAASVKGAQNTKGVKISVSRGVSSVVLIKSPQIKIISVESEIQKRENAAKQAHAVRISQTVQTDNADTTASYSLDELRALYREAGARYNVDPRLIEAVHQIETGKSSRCAKNPSGATGPMQFLASTFRKYNDLNGSICDLRSSVFAAAKLLSLSGASNGDIDSALYSYNHSSAYVAKVKQIMNSI